MVSSIARAAAAATFGLALLGAASASNATIYNISATDNVGTLFSVSAGTYRVSIIGTADGGAYDAANTNCVTGNCETGWTNSFAKRDQYFAGSLLHVNGNNTTVDVLAVGNLGSTFSSALGSLSAYQTSSLNQYYFDINSSVTGPVFGAPVLFGTVPSPFYITLTSEFAFDNHLVVFDPDGNRLNNFGGVSLDITAVPEPTTWAMMLLGFGGLGEMLRRQRRQGMASLA